ncbi:MAG: MmoB/DmpM family protein [Rugosibacter sp.]|jgi:phenol hydroxylase P2 protein|nr:phenol/toluene 2-monooxygenase (NADH) P2/A2 [Rugosibacter sp.]
MSKVFIIVQANEEARPIVEALVQDNPNAVVQESPAMVRVEAEGSLTLNRSTVEALTGQPFDIQQLHINLISISGHIDEEDDYLTVAWNN